MSKIKLFFVVALILILVVIFIKFQYRVDLRELELNDIVIGYTPDAKDIKISDDTQIRNIIEILDTKSWSIYFWWRIKSAPSLILVIDETMIGLFEFDRNYGVVEGNGKTRYYKIPQNTYEKIYNYYKEQSN